jgi:hypothetical protein
MRKWILILLLALGLGVVLASILIFILWRQQPAVKIPAVTRSAVPFAIVAPQKLPSKTAITLQPTYDRDKKIVVTKLTFSSGASMVLSQQARPNIDLKQIDSKESYLTGIGVVYIINGEPKKIQAIIDTGDSWVMLSSDETIGITNFKQLVGDLATDKPQAS